MMYYSVGTAKVERTLEFQAMDSCVPVFPEKSWFIPVVSAGDPLPALLVCPRSDNKLCWSPQFWEIL